MAKKTSVIEPLAAVNRGFLKNVTSSIGWSLWRSHRANTTSSTTPMAKRPTIFGATSSPRSGASMMA